MLDNYFPVLVFILVGLAFGCVPILLGWLIAPNRPDSEKLSAFECGFAAFEDARMKFDVRYYLIAIIFILFDLEIAFLFPWASIFKEIVNTRAVRCSVSSKCSSSSASWWSAMYTLGPRARWIGNERDQGRSLGA
jgi:NADH-quinone oxidoreductase subunit A